MGLSLLFPLGLAALAAWLLPLLVHLARRQESRLTEFAALRWLRAQPRPRQRIRVDEWPLLLLRLLLLALLALLLAGLAWRDDDATRARVLVSPGIDAAALRGLNLPADAHVHWLAAGFPAFDTPMPAGAQPVASLLREFDVTLPATAPLRVLVPADWSALDAGTLTLSHKVDWQVLPGQSPASAAAPAPPLRLAVFGAAPADPALRTLRAMDAAWQPGPTPSPLAVAAGTLPDKALLPAGTLAVWWRDAALPAAWLGWVREGGEVLLAPGTPWPAGTPPQPRWRDANGDVLLLGAALDRGAIYQLPRGLDPAMFPALRDPAFATALAAQLRPPTLPARADARDFAPHHAARQWAPVAALLLPWLPLLIALMFALERWLATSRRRGASA